MTDTQQLVMQAYDKRYAQLWLEYDKETQEHRERDPGICGLLLDYDAGRRDQASMARHSRRIEDLERARFFDLAREYPLCLNPTLNLVPKLIKTRWGVLFG